MEKSIKHRDSAAPYRTALHPATAPLIPAEECLCGRERRPRSTEEDLCHRCPLSLVLGEDKIPHRCCGPGQARPGQARSQEGKVILQNCGAGRIFGGGCGRDHNERRDSLFVSLASLSLTGCGFAGAPGHRLRVDATHHARSRSRSGPNVESSL